MAIVDPTLDFKTKETIKMPSGDSNTSWNIQKDSSTTKIHVRICEPIAKDHKHLIKKAKYRIVIKEIKNNDYYQVQILTKSFWIFTKWMAVSGKIHESFENAVKEMQNFNNELSEFYRKKHLSKEKSKIKKVVLEKEFIEVHE